MTQILVGGVDVGAWADGMSNDLVELGAALSAGQKKTANALMARIKANAAAAQAQALKTPAVAPLAKLGAAAQKVSATVLTLAAQSRFKKSEEAAEQPTHVIPVCFDNVAPGAASGVATITAPHDQPWRLVGIMANDAQSKGIRVVELKFGNTEHVIQSNVTYSTGGPTNPGMDCEIFSGKLYLGNRAQFRYRPWGLGPSGWIRSDAKIQVKVFNPGAEAASINLSFLVQSSPCGEGAVYDDAFVHPKSRKLGAAFHQKFTKNLLSYFRRGA